MGVIGKGREAEAVFRFFEEISAIPRGSYNERKIAEHLVAFAEARGLEVYCDSLFNVLIKAPATKGREHLPPVLLQGHTDMVCEKNSGVEHDFLRDPLDLYVEGKYLRARGTTLGGDDGCAVAIMMAILDGALSEHPALECLFTVSEEVGMEGAKGFDFSKIRARRLINLDSEEFHNVTVGCAGGVETKLTLPTVGEPLNLPCVRISIRGLMGGHSGENINSGRANADKLMGRVLAFMIRTADARLVSICGGSKMNAIPRECVAVIAVPDADAACDLLTDFAEKIASEFHPDDRGFTFTAEETDATDPVMLTREETLRAVAILDCSANGVFEMTPHVKGLVEYSRNLGVVRSDDRSVFFHYLSRSSIEARLDAAEDELETLGRLCGCKIEHCGRYPGWAFAEKSPLRDAYLKAFREVTGEDANVNTVHAGLECGIILSGVPEMDIISVGPTLLDIHSPNERMDMDTVDAFWKILKIVLRDA